MSITGKDDADLSTEKTAAALRTVSVETDDTPLIQPGALHRLFPLGYAPSRLVTRFGPRSVLGSALGNSALRALLHLDQGSDSATAAREGGMVCLNPLGMIIGALCGGILSNSMGRTKGIAFGLCLSLLGAALQTSAQNVEWLALTRVLNGLGVGITDSIVPSWIAELSATGVRSSAIAIELVYAGFGVCCAYWIAYGFGFVNNSELSWRFPVGYQMIFTVLLLIIINFLPESPRWLCSAGKSAEAERILSFMHGDDVAAYELASIQDACRQQKETRASLSYRSMFFGQGNIRRRVLITVCIQFTATFVVAYGMITSYATTVFSFAGFDSGKIAIIAGANNTTYVVFMALGALCADRVGPRNMMLMGAIGCGAMMVVIGAISRSIINASGTTESLGSGLVFCLFLYSALHAASFATMAWVVPVEIYPQASRSRGGALSVSAFAFGNGLSTLIAPYLFTAMRENFFFLFGGLTLLSFPIQYCFVPQTAGRSLEDMDLLLTGPVLYWRAEANYKRSIAQVHTLSA